MRGADRLREWIPQWWRGEAGVPGSLLNTSLLPAELAFRVAVGGRNLLFERGLRGASVAPIPVISVGNLTVGGTGKTPVCAWLASWLREAGHRPAVVLRGYGRDEIAVHRELNPDVPVFANGQRVEGVRAAASDGCDCALLDDGFQHRSLDRDLDIVLVAAEQWTQRRRLLPRGPWREPPSSLERADYVLVTRKTVPSGTASQIADDLIARELASNVGVAHLAPTSVGLLGNHSGETEGLSVLHGRNLLAVTTLADPRPFAAQLREAGANADLMCFGDHHEFTDRDLREISDRAASRPLVVTRKEAVKLAGRVGLPEVYVIEQEVRVERGMEGLRLALDRALGRV